MRKLFFICILFASLSATAKDYIFERYSAQDGLSQNMVLDVFQDSEGYMWFGTFDGLNRYDGYDFEIFKPNDEENSIAGAQIIWICEDQNNGIWTASIDKGVSRYDKLSGKFTNFYNTEVEPKLIIENQISVIFADSENNVWFGGREGLNVISYDEDGNSTITQITHDDNNPNSLPDNRIQFVYEDSKKRIWVNTTSYVCIWNNTGEGKIANNFTPIIRDEDGQGGDYREIKEVPDGFLISDQISIQLIAINDEDLSVTSQKRLENHQSFYFDIDLDGNLWVSGYQGLYYFEYQLGEDMPYVLKKHYTDGEEETTINDLFIRNLFFDKAGILWLGTHSSGFLKCNTRKTQFRHYRSTDDEGSIPTNKVWNFYEDNMSNLWIGTEGGGLSLHSYENRQNYATGWESFPICPPGQQNNLFDFINISDTEIPNFIGGVGYNQIIVRIEQIDDIWQARKILPELTAQAMTLCQDEYGVVWVGMYEGGLAKFDPNDESSLIHYTPDNSTVPSIIIRSITEDSQGRLWIGTDLGLMLLTREQKAKKILDFTLFVNNPDDSLSLSNSYTCPVLETSSGEIWIGTFGGGLNRYQEGDELNNGHFTSIQEKDGLPNNTIKSLIEDELGNLWIGSNGGVTRLDRSRTKIRNFDVHDGLQGLEFTDLSSFKRSDGEILLGGTKGFNAFYPYEITEDTIKPNIVFNKLEVMNKAIQPGEEVDGHIILPNNPNYINELTLRYSENSFTIYFAAIHYALPDGNLYKYMLEGFDEEWITTSSLLRFARYTNISPGEYTFKVLAGNSHGIWVKNAKELTIIIKPPYWQTWWFRILLFIIIVGTGLYFYRRRMEKEKRERAILQEKIDESMKQLEGSKKEVEDAKAEVEGAKEALRIKELEEAEMRFFNRGLAQFSELLGKHNELNELCHSVVVELSEYVDAQLGVIYLITEQDEENPEQFLKVHGTFGGGIEDVENVAIHIGEGNVGTCFKLGEIIKLEDVPKDYIKISSGLGEITPSFVCLIPLIQNENKIGVIEVAAFEKIEEYKINFIKKLGENISSTILLMRAMDKNNLIIEEAQSQAEELRAQEEEMRQNIEELTATQEEFQRLKQQEEGRQEELKTEIAALKKKLKEKK